MAKGQTPENAYSVEERHAALELAASVGVKPAAEQLGVPRGTIYRWINFYPQLWSDLRAGDPEVQRKGIARRLDDLAERYTDTEHEILDKIETMLASGATLDAKSLAALVKSVGSSRHGATVGARAVLGEPDRVEHTINFPQIEQAMERLLEQGRAPALPVPNEAEEPWTTASTT